MNDSRELQELRAGSPSPPFLLAPHRSSTITLFTTLSISTSPFFDYDTVHINIYIYILFIYYSLENEANKRIVEKLKVEKSHLVETVLNLSNELDESEKAKTMEHQRYKNELLKNSELDEKIDSIKLTLCHEVMEVLRQHNVEISIIENIQNKIDEVIHSHCDGLSTTTLSGKSGITTNTVSSGGNKSIPSGNRRKSRPVSRDLLDRDDTDSVISSVSTHRSNR